jgi:adenylylsulfate kinase-like enzyme
MARLELQLDDFIVFKAGMAGSGKTTLLQRVAAHLNSMQEANYILNMDPAVTDVPYAANIDIRDTVSYLSLFMMPH